MMGDGMGESKDLHRDRNQPTPPLPSSSEKQLTVIFPFRSEKQLVAGAAQCAPAVTLQEPDVSSLGESFDTTSSQESITASPRATPHNIIPSGRIEKPVAGAAVPTSELTLQDLALSLLDEFLDNPRTVPDNTTDGSLQSTSSSVGSNILVRSFPNCYQVFYIRMDRKGSFWTYHDVGGPFQRVDEAEDAINCFVDDLHHGARYKEPGKFSHVDRMIHDCKHYLYGPPKRDPNPPSSKATYDEAQYLVQALLDQYNDDNNLFGNHAHELEDLVRKQSIFENRTWYYHFNFTTKQKGADDSSTDSKLFFAEVTHVRGRMACEVSCFCKIETEDNGGHCYGCRNKEIPPLKHPNNINAYAGGHLDDELFLLVTSSSDDVWTLTFKEDNVEEELEEGLAMFKIAERWTII